MTFKKIRFITDSTCDIPPDLVEKYRIGVVPCYINFGGKSYADDGKELNRETFYEQLPHMHPVAKTSGPPPGLAEQIIQDTFKDTDHLFIVTAPSNLSGVYNTLRLSAAKLPEDQYSLIDSGTTTMGLGWQVLIGAEVAAATGDVDATRRAIMSARANQQVWALLSTLDFLRQSGRVGWATAGIGSLLQIKPIISVKDGEVGSIARVRTLGKATEELIRLTREQAPLDKLAILHTNNPDGARDLRQRLGDVAPPDTITVNITPAVGTHSGPGALGVATVSTLWRS